MAGAVLCNTARKHANVCAVELENDTNTNLDDCDAETHLEIHKETCFASQEQKAIVVKPHYDKTISTTDSPYFPSKWTNLPGNLITSGTNIILRVQLDTSSIIAFDRRRNFVCKIRKEDNSRQYAELAEAVGKKGVPPVPGLPGVKAYFLADLKNPNELVIKLDNVLAEQPF